MIERQILKLLIIVVRFLVSGGGGTREHLKRAADEAEAVLNEPKDQINPPTKTEREFQKHRKKPVAYRR